MDYILAAQLKDAGFPQLYGPIEREQDGVRIPTLEELIEAVKNHPMNRKDVGLYCNGGEWVAWARKTNLDEGGDGDRDIRGSTPTEAVARLYIALHAKQ